MQKALMMLVVLSGTLTSCGADLPQYKIVKRCTIDYRFNLCECALYDFNIPKIVSEYESFSIDECLKLNPIMQFFNLDDFQNGIVSIRKKRSFLEQATSKKDLKKRVNSL